MKHYLNLEFKTGMLYQYSLTEKPGYEKYTSGTGNESYRVYYKDGVSGKLRSMYINTGDFGALELRIMIDNGDDSYMVKLPVTNSQGRLDIFVEDLISTFPNMVAGNSYRLFPYVIDTERMGKNGKPIQKRGVSVKEVVIEEDGKIIRGAKVERGLRFLKKDEEYDPKDATQIPPLDFKSGLGGGLKPSAVSLAVKKEFLEGILMREVARLDTSDSYDANATTSVAATTTEAAAPVPDEVPKARGAKASPVAKAKAAPAINIIADEDDEDHDDLPF